VEKRGGKTPKQKERMQGERVNRDVA